MDPWLLILGGICESGGCNGRSERKIRAKAEC